MNKINRFVSIEISLALLIIIAFFLPWIDLGIVKMTGWEIPNLQKKISQVGNFFSRNKSSIYTSYAIFLLPLISTGIIALWILTKEKLARILLTINGIFGTTLSVYLFFSLPKRGSTGIYLLFLVSLLAVIYAVYLYRKKNKTCLIEEDSSEKKHKSKKDSHPKV